MFQRLMNTLARFMQGRYGTDRFNRFLFVLYFVICWLPIVSAARRGGGSSPFCCGRCWACCCSAPCPAIFPAVRRRSSGFCGGGAPRRRGLAVSGPACGISAATVIAPAPPAGRSCACPSREGAAPSPATAVGHSSVRFSCNEKASCIRTEPFLVGLANPAPSPHTVGARRRCVCGR